MLRPVFNLFVFLLKLGLQFSISAAAIWTLAMIVMLISYNYFGYDFLGYFEDVGGPKNNVENYYGSLIFAVYGLIYWIVMAGWIGNATKDGANFGKQLFTGIGITLVFGFVAIFVAWAVH